MNLLIDINNFISL